MKTISDIKNAVINGYYSNIKLVEEVWGDITIACQYEPQIDPMSLEEQQLLDQEIEDLDDCMFHLINGDK